MKESPRHETDPGFTQLSQLDRADQICDAYERERLDGRQPQLEDYLAQVPKAERDNLQRELEVIQRDYERRHLGSGETPGAHETVRAHQPTATRDGKEHPARIGRYQIERLLGQGGFGRVYLAHDEQLRRLVAIKVPHAELVANAGNSEIYLSEARTVANLDHPHIVPVYDVGATARCPCYVVSKCVDGCDLASKVKAGRLGIIEAAELVATVAEALHYAHTQGVVHRDVKPGNILIDGDGRPYVVDFGLALREENIGTGPKYLGTPAYMSPEQASGEGHRVDARSDIFSLGVVLYELLAGQQPFQGETQAELLKQLKRCKPRPLRQIDERIPAELERICEKALALRANERYASAQEFADDLRYYLAKRTVPAVDAATDSDRASTTDTTNSMPTLSALGSESTSRPRTRILPKGLRSFDAHDADFFLELLSGPRDREGLPDSLRFWKTRIEETDPDSTFPVGLIYGPSGCGKTSLVKAGLLPRLSEEVIPVYVEATPDQTESLLLHRLRQRCPAIREVASLKETLAALRRGQGIPLGKKVLIVIDQFEQWLHARDDEQNRELVQALRQCDGARVQCIVMVRDDFWMAANRFMHELEFRLLDGQNSAAVDLLPTLHAEKVLAGFGRAFGACSEQASETEREFLAQAVADLAQEGKVVCVRLALFAEMMKSKAWTPASLREMGGTQGVGATFLEETFSAPTSHPKHRLHEAAARAVLASLLPESGTDIKGQMKSYGELLETSGYAGRSNDFDDLINILDHEVRLITPTNPGDAEPTGDSDSQAESGSKYYQLTHDYLVHSLRDWLTRKQRETRRGRAELRLAEHAALWESKPENRFLPSWWEHADIRLLTDKGRWTQPQRRMMSKARRVHGFRTTLATVLLVALMFAGLGLRRAMQDQQLRSEAQVREKEYVTRAQGLVRSLLNAEIMQVPLIIADTKEVRPWANPLLRAEFAKADDGATQKLHLALGLLPVDERQVDYLIQQLPTCSLHEFPVVREALLPHKTKLTDKLWQFVLDELQDPAQRFQVAAALSEYDPDDDRWKEAAPFVAQYLTGSALHMHVGQWLNHFRSAGEQLTEALAVIHADRSCSQEQRETAAIALADFRRDAGDKLADAILAADEFAEFSPLITALRPHATSVKQQLVAEMKAPMSDELAATNGQLSSYQQDARDAFWKRQSLAAVTLVQLGYGGDVWSLLKLTPDPSLRSYIIHHLGKLQTDHNVLAAHLTLASDVSIRRALIQSLGGLDSTRIPAADRERISLQLQTLYQDDPDPGIHGAALWSLRAWAASIPELPIGEPKLTEQQQQRFAKAESKAKELHRRTATIERELAVRQAEWESALQHRTTMLPASLSEGLVAYFPLDEVEGTVATNALEGQPNGIYQGPGQPHWVPGVVDNALRLEGNGGHINCSHTFNPERTDAFSYGCWLFSENEWYATVLAKMDTKNDSRGFDLFLDNSGRIAAHVKHHWPDNFLKTMSIDPLPRRQWHHVFMTFDGSSNAAGVTIYVDGQAAGTTVLANRLSETIQNNVPLCIGTRSAEYPFRGNIDDVRIYYRCLRAEEVSQLFEFGIAALARVSSENRGPDQQAAMAAWYRPRDEPLQQSEDLDAETKQLKETLWDGVRRWYVNSQGQTMVVIPKSDSGDVLNNHCFAISSHEVTVAEFRRFKERHAIDPMLAPTEDCPVYGTSWYMAAEYCNWLSEQEGLSEDQWVYEPNADGKYAHGMRIKDDYLGRTGYRLPTEAEWEHACRAGASGTYGFGEPVSLLESYGRYVINSVGHGHIVESLLPNEFGIFDMHGNLWEWQQDPSSGPPSPVDNDRNRALRGGTFSHPAWFLRSGQHDNYQPSYRNHIYGFRPARTYYRSP